MEPNEILELSSWRNREAIEKAAERLKWEEGLRISRLIAKEAGIDARAWLLPLFLCTGLSWLLVYYWPNKWTGWPCALLTLAFIVQAMVAMEMRY
jgi:fatty acid desaturase